MNEAQIQRAICDYLALKKHFFFRVNTIPVYDSTRQVFRSMPKYAKKGVPDIVVIRSGQFIGLEVKTPKGKQSIDQVQFEGECKMAGGRYHVVRSVYDVQSLGL